MIDKIRGDGRDRGRPAPCTGSAARPSSQDSQADRHVLGVHPTPLPTPICAGYLRLGHSSRTSPRDFPADSSLHCALDYHQARVPKGSGLTADHPGRGPKHLSDKGMND